MRIGELLVRAGLLSENELAAALKKQTVDKDTSIGQVLKFLNYLKEDELDLVLQAQRKILSASMSSELAVSAIKYAKQNNLSFSLATEKVLVTLRGSQLAMSQSLVAESFLNHAGKAAGIKPTSPGHSVSDPAILLQQSEKAASEQQWDLSLRLLEQARAIFEQDDRNDNDLSIQVYCRLTEIYLKAKQVKEVREIIAKLAELFQRGTVLSPGSVALLASAATLSCKLGRTIDADQLFKLVMPKWIEFLPFEFSQFNNCLRDAIVCSLAMKAPVRKNIRIGELLIDSRLINAEQFQEALLMTKRLHQPLGRIISGTGLLSTQDLRNAIRVQLMCRTGVLPAEYAAATVRAASSARLTPNEFFAKLNLPAEEPVVPSGSLPELVTKMDRLLLMEEMHGVQHPEVAVLADEVGSICLRRAENDEAETLFRRAHAVFAVAGERYQLNLATACQKIGQLLIQQKKYPEAELLLLQSMEIKNRLLGDRHQDVAEALVDVGYLYFCQANYYPAIGFLRSSWMIQQEDSSREQKRYLLELLIKCFEQSGQDAESDIYREQLREIRASD